MSHGMERWRRLQRVDFADMDYPGTLYRARARNFRVPSQPREIISIIIHITGWRAQNESGALNEFNNGPASAHYIVNREGQITQFVRDAHIANHVDNIWSPTNQESIGIEHVNQWDADRQLHPTDVQYQASARLVAWLCRQYGIPPEHNPVPHGRGIRGHIEEAPHSEHRTCPNPAWEWDHYMDRVRREYARVESFPEMIGALARGGR